MANPHSLDVSSWFTSSVIHETHD